MMHGIKNYFRILGFDSVCFDIDSNEINQRYFERQRMHHPDHCGTDFRISAELNEAYCNLIDPLARAQHIFDLNRIDFASSVSLKVFQMLSEPEKNFEIMFDEMKAFFDKGDLNSAYKNWCACQYLKRAMTRDK